jgi:small multidrug resistance pump
MAWALLTGAILLEVTGTLALRMATTGARAWYAVVGVGYVGAFTALALALAEGLALGVAYGTWAAAGVALTAVASRLLLDDPLTPVMGVGIGLIAGGVLLVELGAVSAA